MNIFGEVNTFGDVGYHDSQTDPIIVFRKTRYINQEAYDW